MLKAMNTNAKVSKIKCDQIKRSKWSQRSSLKKGKVKCDKIYRVLGNVFVKFGLLYFYPVFVIMIKEEKMSVSFQIV